MAGKEAKKICCTEGGIVVAGHERSNYEQKKKNDGIHAKDFFIGALTGAVVGSLTALLFAPKSGRELRQDINDQAFTLRDKTENLRSSAISKGNELTSTVKNKTTAISRKVSEQSVDLVKKVKRMKPAENEIEEANPIDELFEQDPHSEIQRKLDETKRAFDETESKLGQ